MRRLVFNNENFYHIFNRGIDKRKIFLTKRDYERFIMALYLFNDENINDYDLTSLDLRGLASYGNKRKQLVEIIHWSFMPNHFHLFIRQNIYNGISTFMQRVGTSYTMYFNKTRERRGRLFEGTFKARHVEADDYFSHLGIYIDTNHTDLIWPGWKENGIPTKNLEIIKERLTEYKWSSFNEYYLKKKSLIPGFTNKKLFFEIFGAPEKEYEKMVEEYLLKGLPSKYKSYLLFYEA